jgi:hypothetical protein
VPKRITYAVEDHGNGFMVIRDTHNTAKWPKYQGVAPREARKVLREYVGKREAKSHGFAVPVQYEGRSACWLAKGPGEVWDGATDSTGAPLKRSS